MKIFNTKEYDTRHGGPYDRGEADSWYSRPRDPHYYVEGTLTSPLIFSLIEKKDMTVAEIEAYNAGYDDNERHGGKKQY